MHPGNQAVKLSCIMIKHKCVAEGVYEYVYSYKVESDNDHLMLRTICEK